MLELKRMAPSRKLQRIKFYSAIPNMAIVFLLFLQPSDSLLSQRNKRGVFDEVTAWRVNEQIYQSFRLKDYELCAELTDSLLRLDSANINGYILRGILAYDKIGDIEKALDLMQILKVNQKTTFVTFLGHNN